MTTLLDLILFVANVVLVTYSVRDILLVITGTTKNYLEWSRGLGGFLFIGGIVVGLLNLQNAIPGRNLSTVLSMVGLAFMLLPMVLHWVAPRLYNRLEEC